MASSNYRCRNKKCQCATCVLKCAECYLNGSCTEDICKSDKGMQGCVRYRFTDDYGIEDAEWERAKIKNEKEEYFWVRYNPLWTTKEGKIFYKNNYIKVYQPSIAELISERTGWIIERVFKNG